MAIPYPVEIIGGQNFGDGQRIELRHLLVVVWTPLAQTRKAASAGRNISAGP
jgi:hypothetical protein